MEELKRHFRPEFLNRIDEVIVFAELSQEEVTTIVDLMIRRVQSQLESQGIDLELTHEAKLLLAQKGYDPQLGARPLRRAIQRMLEDPLSEKILWKEFHAGETIIVDADGEDVMFRAVEGIEPPPVELAGSGPEGLNTPLRLPLNMARRIPSRAWLVALARRPRGVQGRHLGARERARGRIRRRARGRRAPTPKR